MKYRLDPVAELEPSAQADCFGLLARHFSGVDGQGFATDLGSKTHILRFFADEGLVGFSTMAVTRIQAGGNELCLLYSGDTIMDPEHWGSSILATAWLESVYQLTGLGRSLPVYWLLICSGVRTYRLLSLFWQRFVPRHDSNEGRLLTLRDELATEHFGDRYHHGVVRLERPQILRPSLAGIPDHYQRDRHSRHFLRCNPGHAKGNELVCLCPLSVDNLSRAGKRVARRVGLPDAILGVGP